MKDYCNNIYKDLLARLGEIQLQLDNLEQEKKSIKAQLPFLNAIAPEIQKLERSE